MATVNKNLSDYDKESIPNGATMSFGIVVSEWNDKITKGLLQGAVDLLLENNVPQDEIYIKWVPGSFELPLAAQFFAQSGHVDAVIALGCVIQGETKHFDYVCQGTAMGIQEVALKSNLPVIFGVLTDNTEEQSIARSGGIHGNKGTEAAVTAMKMVKLKRGFE